MIPLLAESPLHHVLDEPYEWARAAGTVWFSKQIMMQMIAAGLLLLTLPTVFGAHALVPRGLRNALEAICVYLRENVARPALGEHTDRFIPYLWTLFFFVLFSNLLGLVPHGASCTGNIFVTAALAISTLVMVVVNGLRLQGRAFVAHFSPGPLWLAPLLIPVEIIGLIAKHFALAMRLFANMVAGHVLLAVLLSFIPAAINGLGAGGYAVAAVVVAGSVAINLLELFVAFLHAFIFTFLTGLFLGQAVNIHHDHGHDEHEHGHAGREGEHDAGGHAAAAH
jgi:F-type H+-transporting ATPase subunit a